MNEWEEFFGESVTGVMDYDTSDLDLALEEAQYACEAYDDYMEQMKQSATITTITSVSDTGAIVESVEYTYEGKIIDKIKGAAKVVWEKIVAAFKAFVGFFKRGGKRIAQSKLGQALAKFFGKKKKDDSGDAGTGNPQEITNAAKGILGIGNTGASSGTDAAIACYYLMGNIVKSGNYADSAFNNFVKLVAADKTDELMAWIKDFAAKRGLTDLKGAITVCASTNIPAGKVSEIAFRSVTSGTNIPKLIKEKPALSGDKVKSVHAFISTSDGDSGSCVYDMYEESDGDGTPWVSRGSTLSHGNFGFASHRLERMLDQMNKLKSDIDKMMLDGDNASGGLAGDKDWVQIFASQILALINASKSKIMTFE